MAAGFRQGRPRRTPDGGFAVAARLHTADVAATLPPQVAEESGLLRGGMLGLHHGEVFTIIMKRAETLAGDLVVRIVPAQQIVHVG